MRAHVMFAADADADAAAVDAAGALLACCLLVVIAGQCCSLRFAIARLYASMGRVSGSPSLISRLVGDLPRHELVGVIVGSLLLELANTRLVGDLPLDVAALVMFASCVVAADNAHERSCGKICDPC